jgi:hypothetical protein
LGQLARSFSNPQIAGRLVPHHQIGEGVEFLALGRARLGVHEHVDAREGGLMARLRKQSLNALILARLATERLALPHASYASVIAEIALALAPAALRASVSAWSKPGDMRGGLWRVMAISALGEMAISAHACDELVYCAPTGVAGAAWVIKIHPGMSAATTAFLGSGRRRNASPASIARHR